MTRILIVEDHEDLARGLANNLEIEGFETEIAMDGATGLRRTRESQPDLLILDLMLPEMDGYRVLSELRDAGDSIPVLILTARPAIPGPSSSTERRSVRRGIDFRFARSDAAGDAV